MDTDRLLQSVVTVEATIPEKSFTAPILGTERSGSGIVIGDKGLVLTIGYLITEAEDVVLKTSAGRSVPAHPLAYDQETGFGLVQSMGPLDLPALSFGDSSKVAPGDPVYIAGSGKVIEGQVVARQEFAGYWEYMLEDAIFTAPTHPSWGGAGVVGADGRLLGIGSLQLQAATLTGEQDINMVVPIALLPPILDDLVSSGRTTHPPRPWLGLYSADHDGQIVALNVDSRGPAAAAGMQAGDIIRDVRDQSVDSLAGFYREVWASGPAGTEIPLRIIRDGREQWVRIKSADRDDFLRKPVLQ
ncbi:MAG: S1C family serine protease [Mesorhizobium sp.]